MYPGILTKWEESVSPLMHICSRGVSSWVVWESRTAEFISVGVRHKIELALPGIAVLQSRPTKPSRFGNSYKSIDRYVRYCKWKEWNGNRAYPICRKREGHIIERITCSQVATKGGVYSRPSRSH